MDTRSPSAIAEAWIEKWSAAERSAVATTISESALDWELPRKQPELCLAAILEVLSRIDVTTPNQLLAVLAAGPLEDLLNHNSEAVVEQVDLLARRDPGFRLLLNGVWDSGINPSILSKLAKYRGNPW